MKLLKIGSAQSNDIVLNSVYVSAHHAEITILDSGEILLEDKSSSNGTFVGNKRIEPNTEVTIRRGDYIRFADVDLVWGRVPVLPSLSAYNAVINIGSNYRNDIVLNSGAVSRYHATVLVKGHKAVIRDNGSKNGTQVNGIKITAGKEVAVKKGDNILCAGEDVSDQLSALLPSVLPSWSKWVGVAALVVSLCVGIYWAIRELIDIPDSPDIESSVVNPNDYVDAVAYFEATYQFVVEFEDNPLPTGAWDGVLTFPNKYTYSGTAFFIDKEGRLATNRHIAEPWNYRTKKQEDDIRNLITDFVRNVKIDEDSKDVELRSKQDTIFAAILLYGIDDARIRQIDWKKSVNRLLTRLRNSEYRIKGKLRDIKVGYAGLYYTEKEEYDHCNVLRVSNDEKVDLAILQLNNHVTPSRVKKVFNLNNIYKDKLIPMLDKLYTIGYPAGKYRGIDETTKSLKPTIIETKCVKDPTRYDFEVQESSIGGSSGSPIFNEYGQLVGILFGGYQNSTTLGVHARYLQRLYEEEVNY